MKITGLTPDGARALLDAASVPSDTNAPTAHLPGACAALRAALEAGEGEPDPHPAPLDVEAAEAAIRKAREHVSALCHGERWTMRVPARPGIDSDLVISDGLTAGERALRELQRTQLDRDAAQQRLAEIRRDYACPDCAEHIARAEQAERERDRAELQERLLRDALTKANDRLAAARRAAEDLAVDVLAQVDGFPDHHTVEAGWIRKAVLPRLSPAARARIQSRAEGSDD